MGSSPQKGEVRRPEGGSLDEARAAYAVLSPRATPEMLRLSFPLGTDDEWGVGADSDVGFAEWQRTVEATWNSFVYSLRAHGHSDLTGLRASMAKRHASMVPQGTGEMVSEDSRILAFRLRILDSVLWHYEVLGYAPLQGAARSPEEPDTPGLWAVAAVLMDSHHRLEYVRDEIAPKAKSWEDRYRLLWDVWYSIPWPDDAPEFPYSEPHSLKNRFNAWVKKCSAKRADR